jgi:PAS domain S-box-containing protein
VTTTAWFPAEDSDALEDFFGVYVATIDIRAILVLATKEDPTFEDRVRAMASQWTEETAKEKRVVLTNAIRHADWGPYEAQLRAEAILYAEHSVHNWQLLSRLIARQMTTKLVDAYESEPRRLANALRVMHEFLERARAVVTAAYLARRESMLREVEETLRKLEEEREVDARFRALVEAAPDAMVIVDEAAGRIALVNKQAEILFGYVREELVGQPFSMLIPERFREEEEAAHASKLERVALRKGGVEVPVEITSSPLVTDRGVLVSSAIRDITDRRRMETALKVSNRELESFSYSVAHDLRGPLRGINGFAQILLAEHAAKLDDEGKECLHQITTSAMRMADLIDALLLLARVTRTELKPQKTNLSQLARASLSDIVAAERDRERAAEIVVADGIERWVDPGLARLLLDNLLANAWKFTSKRPKDARIEFGQNVDGTVFISDNGAGFDMAHKRKLFSPFQRLHQTTDYPGTGIGLATAQRVVDRHGGKMWAESKVGDGATFFFVLPRTEP